MPSTLSSNIKTSGAVLFVAWINVHAGRGIHSSCEGGRIKLFTTTYTLDYSSNWSETNFEEESYDEATCMSYPWWKEQRKQFRSTKSARGIKN